MLAPWQAPTAPAPIESALGRVTGEDPPPGIAQRNAVGLGREGQDRQDTGRVGGIDGDPPEPLPCRGPGTRDAARVGVGDRQRDGRLTTGKEAAVPRRAQRPDSVVPVAAVPAPFPEPAQ